MRRPGVTFRRVQAVILGMRGIGGGWQARAGLTVLAVVVTLAVGSSATRIRVAGAGQATLPSTHTIAAGAVDAVGRVSSLYAVTVVYGRGRTLYYVDPAHQATEMVFLSPAGATEDVYAVRAGGTRVVDYVRHTWHDSTAGDTTGAIENPAHGIALELQESMPSVVLNSKAGIEMVVGEHAYKLVLPLPDGSELTTIWISTTTALPVKSSSPGVTATYRWDVPRGDVPKSLWPAVPAGFREDSDPTTRNSTSGK